MLGVGEAGKGRERGQGEFVEGGHGEVCSCFRVGLCISEMTDIVRLAIECFAPFAQE